MPPIGRVNLWDVTDEHGRGLYNEWGAMWSDFPLYADMQDTIAFLRQTVDAAGISLVS